MRKEQGVQKVIDCNIDSGGMNEFIKLTNVLYVKS